jgi:hypothetical protein
MKISQEPNAYQEQWKMAEVMYRKVYAPKKNKECEHEVYHLDEEENRCHCLKCKQVFPYDPYLCDTDTELSCYEQEYSTIRMFDKYLRRLRRENPDLPEIEPLHSTYVRFIETYTHCKFYRDGRQIGMTRNLFGNAYTLYRLAKLIGETMPRYNEWAAHIKPKLPSAKHLSKLNDHWSLINARLPPSLFSKHGRVLSFAHLLQRKRV